MLYLFLCGVGLTWDKILRDKVTRSVACRLKRTVFDNHDASNLFESIFDRVFDTQKYRRPRLTRSFCASYLVFLVLAVVWIIVHPERINDIPSQWETLSAVLAFILVLNPIGDFFSLWQTRVIIGYLACVQRIRYFISLLFVDLVLTIIAFVITATLWKMALEAFISLLGYQTGGMFYLRELYCVYTLRCDGSGMLYSEALTFNSLVVIILFTTMLTSIWLWVFFVGILLWSILGSIHRMVSFGWIHRMVNVEKYPITTIMALGGLPISPILILSADAAVAFFQV